MKITIVEVGESSPEELQLTLPEGADIAAAISAAGLSYNESDAVSLWGRRAHWDTPLMEGARVELARALRCDPKRVRREHAAAQGDIRIVTRGKGRHGGRRREETPND